MLWHVLHCRILGLAWDDWTKSGVAARSSEPSGTKRTINKLGHIPYPTRIPTWHIHHKPFEGSFRTLDFGCEQSSTAGASNFQKYWNLPA